MNDIESEIAARWAKAAKRADGITDLGVNEALRTYFLVHLPLGVVGLTGISLLIVTLIWGNDVRENWSAYLTPCLGFAGAGIIIGGLIYGSKRIRPKVSPERIGVLIGLTPVEQKSIRKQIFGRIPFVLKELAVSRGAAVQQRENLARQLAVSPGVMLILMGQFLIFDGLVLRSIWVLMACLLVAVFIMAVWQFRQTGLFLRHTATAVNQRQAEE